MGRTSQIKTFNGRTGQFIASFSAFNPTFLGGAFVGGPAEAPVRVTTLDADPDASRATFELSEHAADGTLLRASTLEPRVAG